MERLFDGRTALVTGASRGIGAATAITLAQRGMSRLILHYNSYQEGLDRVVASVRDAGSRADVIQADLGCESGIEAFLKALKAADPSVDVLVNNAGSLVKRAKLVNVSSIAARTGGGIGAAIYAAAKAAVSTITKGLAKELAPHGIRVNAVSPGTVDNHFHEQFSTRQMLDGVVSATPAGTLGSNEEVADTILFLCSDAARYIHGQTIEINGGMFMV